MPKSKSKRAVRYTPEFRRQVVELVSAGRKPSQLAREFGCTSWTISRWLKQSERDAGRGDGGLTTSERQELTRTAAGESPAQSRAGDSLKSRGLVRTGDRSEFETLFGFVKVNQATHPVGTMCRLLKVSRSGFHAWKARPMSKRERQDLVLKGAIEAIHRGSHETYGSPRVHRQLRAEGVYVGCKRVERLMREMQLQGACRRKFITTTQRDANARPAPDLVNRHFEAAAPDQLWVADATYIPTWRASCTWRSCWMCTAVALWGGRWRITSEPTWC